MTVSNHEVLVQQFSKINISIPDPSRVHIILRKTFPMLCIVKKQLALFFKRLSSHEWHKNISSFRYLIECWITLDCNKFDCVLFTIRFQPNWETISKCQLWKQDARWELDFCSTKLGVSDFKNRLNCFMDYKAKNSAQLGRETRKSFLNPTLNFICFFPNIVH